MKILHVVDEYVGNRCYKEAYCMKQKGIEQEVLCTMEGDPTFMYIFDTVTLAIRADYAIKIMESDADIIIIHDRPTALAPVIRQIRRCKDRRPIIFEHYDLTYYLGKTYETKSDEEEYMLQTSDAVVHMGILNQEHSHEIYDYDVREIIVMSTAPRDWIPERSKNKIDTVVYEGGAANHGGNEHNKKQRQFRDLYDIYWGFRNNGITMDIYAPGAGSPLDYPVMQGLQYHELLYRLTQYQWGFMGHNLELPILQKAGPCKVWEYSMAGLPIIAMNMDDVVDQTNKGGIVKCHSVEEAVEIMKSADRKKLAKESFDTCRYLDDEIAVLIDTCKTLIGE